MESSSFNGPRQSEIAQRIAALIDQGSSEGASKDEIDISECLSMLKALWPKVGHESLDGGSDRSNGSGEHNAEQESLPQRLGRFEIRKLLGHGGFGVVLLAYDETLDREVALKVPRPEFLFSQDMRSRFIREAKAAALLDHPGIVPVYDAGEVGPIWYIAAGYVKGPSLAKWLRDNPKRLTPRTSSSVVLALADAVQHAHSRGILHRDLKPSNVLLEPATAADAFPFSPRLTDFGLAKRLESDDQETLAGTLLGTPRYMAPEQAGNREKEIGIQTDVYGLGAILHELITGEPPFMAESNEAVLARIQNEEVSPTRLRQSNVPKDLETICLKCLEREPARRYQTAGDLAEDLRRYLAGEPVAARPIGRASRLARWARRRPVVAALSSGLAVAIATGTIVAGWQWMRAEEHLRQSLAATSRAEDNLAQAEQTLLDLAWLVEESSVWDQESSQFRDAVQEKLTRYHERVARQQAEQSASSPITAAIHSFAARNAALAGDSAKATEEFRLALDAWHQAAATQPEKAEYRRALALCLLQFSRFVCDDTARQGNTDRTRTLWELYGGLAEDSRFGPLMLGDFAQLMLDHGVKLSHTSHNRGHDALEAGLITAQVLCGREPEDTGHRLLTGKLWRCLAVVEGSMREPTQWKPSFGHAIQILETLRHEDPANTSVLTELAETYYEQGVFARRIRDNQLAVDSATESVKLCEALAQTPAGDSSNRMRLAVSLRVLGNAYLAQNRSADVLQTFTRYGNLLDDIARRGEEIPPEEFRSLGRAWYQVGILQKSAANFEAAKDAFLRGALGFERAVSGGVKFASVDILNHGDCYFWAARILHDSNHGELAKENYEKVIVLLRTEVAKSNVNPHLKELHGKSVAALEEFTRQSQLITEADSLRQRKLALASPNQTRTPSADDRLELAKTHRRLGSIARERARNDEARTELETAVDLLTSLAVEDGNVEIDLETGRACRELGMVRRKAADDKSALPAFTLSHAAFKRVWDKGALSGNDAMVLGNACHQEGTLANRNGDRTLARRAFSDGAQAFQYASEHDEQLADTERFEWAECHAVLGIVQAAEGEASAAAESLETAISMLSRLLPAAESNALFKLRLEQWRQALAETKRKIADPDREVSSSSPD